MQDATPSPKSELRQTARTRRQALDMIAVSRAIQAQLTSWEVFLQAETVLTYAALTDEVDLLALVAAAPEKRWYLPRVVSETELGFHRYAAGDTLIVGPYGIREPLEDAELLPPGIPVDLVLVPGLMVDRQGTRLGFGKGYYDRALTMLGQVGATACPLPEALLSEAPLPQDPWDVPVGWVVTETGIYRLN
jgi:5-formyltetrahydrofolate cyclo-ligase